MSEMIERVAKVLYDLNPFMDQEVDGDYRPIGSPYALDWGSEGLDDDWREEFRKEARCVLEAMREPTETMHHGARDWSYKHYGKPVGLDGSDGCWKAMIDAALPPVGGE
jgi:hypothetical protein